MALQEKQRRFAEEYIVDLNASQAAIRAGYSEKTAGQIGSRLLKNVEVQEAVKKAKEKRAKRLEITQDRVLTEMAKLAFSNMLDYVSIVSDGAAVVDLSALTEDQAAAIKEITVEEYKEGGGDDARDVKRVKLKLADKKPALESLGHHLGMFKRKVELTGENGGPIQHEDVTGRVNEVESGIREAFGGTAEDA